MSDLVDRTAYPLKGLGRRRNEVLDLRDVLAGHTQPSRYVRGSHPEGEAIPAELGPHAKLRR